MTDLTRDVLIFAQFAAFLVAFFLMAVTQQGHTWRLVLALVGGAFQVMGCLIMALTIIFKIVEQ